MNDAFGGIFLDRGNFEIKLTTKGFRIYLHECYIGKMDIIIEYDLTYHTLKKIKLGRGWLK